jgi:hypothetical protein
MMNLLARILSHGFALLVVVLIAITLMYRGDLFPEWGLPEFLVIKDKSDAGTDAASGTADRTLPEAVATTSPESATGVPLVAPQTEAPQTEAPQTEAPQTEAPQTEAPQTEAPQVEVIEEVVTQDVVSPVEVVVPDAVDASRETSPDATAGEDEVAVPEPMLAEPVVTAASSSPTTAAAASTGSSESTPDESDASVPQVLDVQGQAEEKQAVPSVTVTDSEVVTEQLEPPLPDMVPPTPAAEPVTDPQPESEAAPVTATVTESEVVTEQLEPPLPDMVPPTPAAEPVPDSQPESVATAATSLESNAGKSTYELLAAAREAYWLHDYEGAENHYRLLIQLEPDNPDWYGELGNMYFSQGKWQQASAVYYESGVRLLNAGKILQARQMVDVIRGLSGVEADDLENQINASQVAP